MNIKQQTVLIVEDEIEALNTMIEIFELKFSKVLFARNGVEAIEVYESNFINVILCDINLPKLDGLEVVKRIRRDDFKTPIILISAYTDANTLFKAANSYVQGYIKKPIVLDDIQEVLEKISNYEKKELNYKEHVKLTNKLFFDSLNFQIVVNNKRVDLTTKEHEFLKLLIKYNLKVVPYNIIEQVVWYEHGTIMTSTSLRTLVKNLRKKLQYDVLENVSKIGYRLKLRD
ncbi:MAG: response regulator transcription factor [Campylobacterota bacterium]